MRTRVGSFVRERVVRRLLPYDVQSFTSQQDRVRALHRAWGHVFANVIEGGYYEFGVYRGETFRASYRVYQELWGWAQGQLNADERWRREALKSYAGYRHAFYAFDTFSGMPENEEECTTFSSGNFACSLEEFSRLNRQAGLVEGAGVKYFTGTFADLAAREREACAALQPAAIVNIDCDLYESARDALKLVGPKLMQGTVLLVDDWNAFAADRHRGERKAMQGFLAAHPELSIEPWFPYAFTGQAFLVHRQDGRPA